MRTLLFGNVRAKVEPVGQFDRAARLGRDVAGLSDGEDRRADRVSGMDDAAAIGRAKAGGLGKAGGDPSDPRRQEAVGAAEHGVLLVDQGGEPHPVGGDHRRQRRIAAKAHHHPRRDAAEEPPCRQRAQRQFGGTRRLAPQRPDRRTGRQAMHGDALEHRLVAGAAAVGGEMHGVAAADQHGSQSARRKQMPAGAAGGDDVVLAHNSNP